MKKYYIYHIPTFRHKDGRIGKIGCTEEEDAKVRVENQGYTEYEILETHTDIIIASDREIELQKQYGYPVDKVPYYEFVKVSIKGGKTQGPIQGRINAESGHLASICSIGGKTCSDMGFLAEARKIAIQKTSKPVLVYKKDGTFVGEFTSQRECARQLKICDRHICSVCNGKRKSTGGYVIKYKPTEDET